MRDEGVKESRTRQSYSNVVKPFSERIRRKSDSGSPSDRRHQSPGVVWGPFQSQAWSAPIIPIAGGLPRASSVR